jgi:heme/copper-type cytochrome/quinol oxidase subunit 4
MIKYIKLSALNISVVSLVGLVIWLVMDYRESNGVNLSVLGFTVLITVLLSYLVKDVWKTYDELKK